MMSAASTGGLMRFSRGAPLLLVLSVLVGCSSSDETTPAPAPGADSGTPESGVAESSTDSGTTALACKGTPISGSCVSKATNQCTEYSGLLDPSAGFQALTVEFVKKQCVAIGATWEAAACPTAGADGGGRCAQCFGTSGAGSATFTYGGKEKTPAVDCGKVMGPVWLNN